MLKRLKVKLGLQLLPGIITILDVVCKVPVNGLYLPVVCKLPAKKNV